ESFEKATGEVGSVEQMVMKFIFVEVKDVGDNKFWICDLSSIDGDAFNSRTRDVMVP
ncbi:hypothetical protein Tco_1508042, partial [Tanacetum coccineum]